MKTCLQCGLPMVTKVIRKAKKGERRGSIERYVCEHGHEEAKEWNGDRFSNDNRDEETRTALKEEKGKRKNTESFDTPSYGEPETEF